MLRRVLAFLIMALLVVGAPVRGAMAASCPAMTTTVAAGPSAGPSHHHGQCSDCGLAGGLCQMLCNSIAALPDPVPDHGIVVAYGLTFSPDRPVFAQGTELTPDPFPPRPRFQS